jgi:hypothetical protein
MDQPRAALDMITFFTHQAEAGGERLPITSADHGGTMPSIKQIPLRHAGEAIE